MTAIPEDLRGDAALAGIRGCVCGIRCPGCCLGGSSVTNTEIPEAVTVLVSSELLAHLEQDWSPPVHVWIRRTPGVGSGYEMIASTHTCDGRDCGGLPHE